VIVWNRVRMVRDPETGNRISRVNDATDIQRTVAADLALLSAPEWEAAQAVRAARSNTRLAGRYTRKPKRLLSGLLRCGCCGGGMSVQGTRNGITRIRCSRAVEAGTCTNKRAYRLERIERAVIEGVELQLEHPDLLAAYVKAYRDERMRDAAEAVRTRSATERRHKQLKAEFGRLLDRYARGDLSVELFDERALPIQEQWKQLGAQLEAMPATPVIELHPQAVEKFRETVTYLSERMAALDLEGDRDVVDRFRSLIDSVVIRDTPGGGVEAEVIGRLTALVPGIPDVGGRLVAGARPGRSPNIVLGTFAA
jgi:site-specific DNA recombinase